MLWRGKECKEEAEVGGDGGVGVGASRHDPPGDVIVMKLFFMQQIPVVNIMNLNVSGQIFPARTELTVRPVLHNCTTRRQKWPQD